ncbi:MAG: hypothetical protein ACI835_005302 [Planctomycetota bacterium]|jgi:hypothetical protein
MTPQLLLLIHAAATLFMTGLIWFVQVVHYPLFAGVSHDRFAQYERDHTKRAGWVVGPPMLTELGTAATLIYWRPNAIPAWAVWLGLALLGIIWLSTLLQQVPEHRRLLSGFDADSHRRLVRTNWIRTFAWTTRAGLSVWFIFLSM